MHNVVGYHRVLFDGYIGRYWPTTNAALESGVKYLASKFGDPATSHYLAILENGQAVHVRPKNREVNPKAEEILNATLL